MMFDEKKASYNMVNSYYSSYEANLTKSVDGSEECLTFMQTVNMVKINIFRFNDTQSAYESYDSGKIINKHNSLIFHALWLDDN
jgi:hypothetical protein